MTLQDASNKPAPRRRKVDLKAHGQARSRVSNGKDILPDCDGRSMVARRYRDIASQILADQGGPSECGEARQQLVRRFAAACVLAEMREAQLANGAEISITEHALLCSTLTRLASRIGIDRIPKSINHIEESFLRGWNEEAAE
jgi:hypothetical protein